MTYRTQNDIQSTLSPTPPFPPPYIWSSLIFHHSTTPTSSHIIPHQQRLLVCLSCCLECITSPSKRSTIPGALQTSIENPSLQDTNMKLMKTQGASDAVQMAHYKLTIIIIIIINFKPRCREGASRSACVVLSWTRDIRMEGHCTGF